MVSLPSVPLTITSSRPSSTPPPKGERSMFTSTTSVPDRSLTVVVSNPASTLRLIRSTSFRSNTSSAKLLPPSKWMNCTRSPFAETSNISLALFPLNCKVSVPAWPSTMSLPSPGFHTKVSLPAPSSARSSPVPPKIVSSPSRPWSTSSPASPASMLGRALPRITSLKALPVTFSKASGSLSVNRNASSLTTCGSLALRSSVTSLANPVKSSRSASGSLCSSTRRSSPSKPGPAASAALSKR